MKKLTLNQFLNKSKTLHNDCYNYSRVLYINSRTKVIIICNQHGEFTQTPNKHLAGQGCPKCGYINISIKNKKYSFIFDAMNVHGNRYDYSNVNYRYSSNKVKIICSKHGEFLQTPAKHLMGQNCPKCSINSRALKNLVWNKTNCINNARKYNTQIDWLKSSKGAYESARKNKWLNECCTHMEKSGSIYKRLIYAFEFPDNSVYVGLTYNSKKRKNTHLIDYKSQVYKHSMSSGLKAKYKELTKYLDRDIAAKKEGEFLENYKLNGWNVLNKAKTGALGGSIIKWTKDNCLAEAKKYKTKTEWRKFSESSYVTACKNKWIKFITQKLFKKI